MIPGMCIILRLDSDGSDPALVHHNDGSVVVAAVTGAGEDGGRQAAVFGLVAGADALMCSQDVVQVVRAQEIAGCDFGKEFPRLPLRVGGESSLVLPPCP